MVNLTLCRLCPTAPIHLGERGIGMEETSDMLHSDSLFGAISCAWTTLYGKDELEALIEAFLKGEAPFVISSGFPFVHSLLLFPKPLVALAGLIGAEDDKKIRRAEFVSKEVFEWIINGRRPDHCDWDFLLNGNKIVAIVSESEKTLIESNTSRTVFWERHEAPHVVLDRGNLSSSIFRVGEVSFSEGAGLYFLTDIRDKKIVSKFDGALRLLGDEGIGGERSSGKGSFDFKREAVEIRMENSNSDNNINSNSGFLALLSLYHPTRTEAGYGLLKRSKYQLITRRGWISSQASRRLRKKTVRMIAEGSVIPRMGSLPKGALVDVTPQEMKAHRVYANGLALAVPMKVSP